MEGKQELFKQLIDAFKLHRFNKTDAQEYLNWVKLFLSFHKLRNPNSLELEDIKCFLGHLSDEKCLMPSKQKQAYLAVNFFYNQVLRRSMWSQVKLGDELEFNDDFDVSIKSANTQPNVPVWTHCLQEPYRLVSQIMFQTGLQLKEVLELRLEDVDLSTRVLRVRDAFGDFSEIEVADELFQPLSLQVKKSLNVFAQDTRQGSVVFKTPESHRKNFTDNSRWYFLFPGTLQFNLHTQQRIRESLKPDSVEQAFEQARNQSNDKVVGIKSRYSRQAVS